MGEPSKIDLNTKQVEELSSRLEQSNLSTEDKRLVLRMLSAMLWMSSQLEAGRLGLGRLKKLIFGEKTESRKNLFPTASPPMTKDGSPEPSASEPKQPVANHGRRPASEFKGAKRVYCAHGWLKAGDVCPECRKGKLYPSSENGLFVRFVGSPPLVATVYETEKLRCGSCGKLFEAQLPQGVPAVRYDESAKSMAALMRFGYGFPHYRLEKLQNELGQPVSDSVLWELAEGVADCGHPAYELLVKMAAQGEQMNLDDTKCRILDLIRENKKLDPDKDRVGIFTSALLSRVEGHEIPLFMSGRRHCGENIEELLKKRAEALPPPRLMVDGTNVLPKDLKVILQNCLTHGRRQFADIRDSFPAEVEYVIDLFAEIYRNDSVTQEQGMNDDERLRYHQEHSGPVIEKLKAWCHDQIALKRTEPNSPLGSAIRYLEKRWEKLTLFLRIPGAPLSNDIVERLIKRVVLHRKNSLFYKSQHGAVIGDILMTLIQTTVRAGKDPCDYLTELQRHRSELKKNPAAWLPWNYETSLSATKSAA